MYFRGPFPTQDVDPCGPCAGAVAAGWLLATLGIVDTTLTAYAVLTAGLLALLVMAIVGPVRRYQAMRTRTGSDSQAVPFVAERAGTVRRPRGRIRN